MNTDRPLTEKVKAYTLASIGALFAITGIAKAFYPDSLAIALMAVGWPEYSIPLLIFLVICVEIYLGVNLIMSKNGVYAAGLIVLLCAFTGYLLIVMRIAPSTPCGCLGLELVPANAKSQHWIGVVRNIVLILLLVFASDYGGLNRIRQDVGGGFPRSDA